MKSIVIFLIVAVATSSAKLVCTPGLRYNDDCNSCVCYKDGTGAVCTYMQCPVKSNVFEYAATDDTKLTCEPGKKFKLNENTECTCKDSGTEAECSLENKFFSAKSFDIKNHNYCESESLFSPDGCNTCKCNRDGTRAMCTLKLCPSIKSLTEEGSTEIDSSAKEPELNNDILQNKPKQVCQPGTPFRNYCNYCFCSKDGTKFGCTRMFCDTNAWNKDGSLKVDSVSEKIEESKITSEEVEENDDEPEFSLRMLPIESSRRVCEPRKNFKSYCNTCFCSEDGTSYSCTKMACDPQVWNEDGSTKVIPELAKAEVKKRVCEPQTTFRQYCNLCTCSNDGTNLACTMMYCDKNLWNLDGSLKISAIENKEPVERTLFKASAKRECEPLTQFKEYCNTCMCSADGFMKACTLMACDKRIFNKDGSLKRDYDTEVA